MNWDQVQGNWRQITGKVQQKWAKLTNDDLSYIQGRKEELAGKLQAHYGYNKEQAEREIDDFMDTL